MFYNQTSWWNCWWQACKLTFKILRVHWPTVNTLCKLELIMWKLFSVVARLSLCMLKHNCKLLVWVSRWAWTLAYYILTKILSWGIFWLACVQSMKEKVVFSMMQALLAMGDIDSALMSLTKASNIEPNDGEELLGFNASFSSWTKVSDIDLCLDMLCQSSIFLKIWTALIMY